MTDTKLICANLIEKNGSFLLVRETKKIARGLYNFPAGKLEPKETIVGGAVREAKEETGLNIQPQYVVGVYQYLSQRVDRNVIVFVFASKIRSGLIMVTAEHPEVAFFPLQAIKRLAHKKLLRGSYILAAIHDYRKRNKIPLSHLRYL